MEGVIASTILSTWGQWLNEIKAYDKVKREVYAISLLPPVETCLERIQQRNGGKEIKEDLVKSKWNSVKRGAVGLRDIYCINSLEYDNSDVDTTDPEVIKNRFLQYIE